MDQRNKLQTRSRKFMRVLLAPLLGAALAVSPAAGGQAAAENKAETPVSQRQKAYLTEPVLIKAKGTFVGLEDGHTVEIDVYGEPVSLQFTEPLEQAVGRLDTGDQVIFTYSRQEFKDDPDTLYHTLLGIKKTEAIRPKPVADAAAGSKVPSGK
ncbi:hypothetical protein ACE6ED_10120 [Paenibacillus sp. CN-4]|uniref:hypothetical protein n=1 Tax=Paenibacillus nanchangensis TaxID=3348343 RepID=UPI00397B6FC8